MFQTKIFFRIDTNFIGERAGKLSKGKLWEIIFKGH